MLFVSNNTYFDIVKTFVYCLQRVLSPFTGARPSTLQIPRIVISARIQLLVIKQIYIVGQILFIIVNTQILRKK